MRIHAGLLLGIAFYLAWLPPVGAQQTLFRGMKHVRVAGPREWSTFPEKSEASAFEVLFKAKAGDSTLQVRHQDVKQTWQILLNGKLLSRLSRDEDDMVVYFPVDAKLLKDGDNVLRIEQDTRRKPLPDDVRFGDVMLHRGTIDDVTRQATCAIKVIDGSGKPTPARVTIVNDAGALQSVGAVSNDHLAVRPGVVYTSTGRAEFGLPAGSYTIYAGRGFEYSLATEVIRVKAGDKVSKTLKIRREVPMQGYVACDSHVHTLTHSGHGDATVQERMITLAAEGIELPIATDHNVHIDHRPFAKKMGVSRYFTPVVGNEVTTPVGHFNVFPVDPGAAVPNYRLKEWKPIFGGIFATPGVRVCILNHARDLHSGVRPFGPVWHNALVGENLQGWKLQANAMEVVNSGAMQTDVLRLFHDWMGLLNRGLSITPVGSSDSHDVARHFVGQGRTYIRCPDDDPGNIDVHQAVKHFLDGRVMVSYGLAVELGIGKYEPGDLVPLKKVVKQGNDVPLRIRVLGPGWVGADRLLIYVNGKKVRDLKLDTDAESTGAMPGVKWQGTVAIHRPLHDVHVVAIALGPGVEGAYWKTAKPYQPTSPIWHNHVVGSSGALWLDGDDDGIRSPARAYAEKTFKASAGDLRKLVTMLAGHDEAVAAQAAHLYRQAGHSVFDDDFQQALERATPALRRGFEAYRAAWRECQAAQTDSP